MVTMIISNGIFTIRKKGETVKQHILRQAKSEWIATYLAIPTSFGDNTMQEALRSWNKTFPTNKDFEKYVYQK